MREGKLGIGGESYKGVENDYKREVEVVEFARLQSQVQMRLDSFTTR